MKKSEKRGRSEYPIKELRSMDRDVVDRKKGREGESS